MKCPACEQEGKKSRLNEGGSSRTLMACQPYYDEDGKRHHHDSNTTTTSYSCSNGHSFTVARQGSCWCGWNKDALPRITPSKPFYPQPVSILKLEPLTGLDGKPLGEKKP